MKIVIKTTDGVAIMSLVGDSDAAEAIRKWKEVNLGRYISHREMPNEAIPSERAFRAAWCDESPELVIDFDIPKARGILREGLRRTRNPLLAALDVEYLQADESGDSARKAEIIVEKQKLRDITTHSAIESATTIDQLLPITFDALLAG